MSIQRIQKLQEQIAEVTPNLPNDVCRCHDEACPQAQECRRFLQRERGGAWVSHTGSLRSPDGTCNYWIPVN